METERHNITKEDRLNETLVSPRFDEETRATARPVVPLNQTGNARGTVRNIRKTWPWGLALILTISVAVGIAATLIYRNSVTSAPSATSTSVSEAIIKAVPEPASLAPSDQPVRAREFEARTTPRKRMESPSALTVHDELADRDWKDEERRDEDEEKSAERARKEEKKRLKRLRKEAEKLAEGDRDSEESDKPKPRLVGVYTVRRKH